MTDLETIRALLARSRIRFEERPFLEAPSLWRPVGIPEDSTVLWLDEHEDGRQAYGRFVFRSDGSLITMLADPED